MYSLGGGCYVKWALDGIGMKRETQFFDYMWNLQGGLKTLVSIMKDDFTPFLDRTQYEYMNTHTILNWDYFNIHKSYPDLALMHYDTRNDDIFNSICRKVVRTRALFRDTTFKIFIYYRGYYKPSETVCTLQEESEYFVKEYSDMHNSNFVLVSLVEIPKEESQNGTNITKPLKNTDKIYYDYVIRDDMDHWKYVVEKYKNLLMPS